MMHILVVGGKGDRPHRGTRIASHVDTWASSCSRGTVGRALVAFWDTDSCMERMDGRKDGGME